MANLLIYDPNGELTATGIGGIFCATQNEFLQHLREKPDFDAGIIVQGARGKLPIERFLHAVAHRAPLLPIALIGTPNPSLKLYADVVISDVPSKRTLNAEIQALLKRRKIMMDAGLIGRSNALAVIADTISRIADTDIAVLITGESGTGKELVAKAIHNLSPRADKPFVAINCGAIPETLLESQLFGHKRGSFTGAHRDFAGFFAQAQNGTLFLDEIGEVSLSVQVKLLRVIETREYFPIGSAQPKHTDARIITATNSDPALLIQQGKFRKDLYYRLSGVRIFIPPLRERPEDIPILTAYFANRIAKKSNTTFAGFGDDALEEMMQYHWPGNVRELRNLVETAVILSDGAVVHSRDIKPYFNEHSQFGRNLPAIRNDASNSLGQITQQITALLQQNNAMLREILRELKSPPSLQDAEREAIVQALRKYGGSRKKAAKELGISVRTLYRKMKRYELK